MNKRKDLENFIAQEILPQLNPDFHAVAEMAGLAVASYLEKWRPIETAPKCDVGVLLYDSNVYLGVWVEFEDADGVKHPQWVSDEGFELHPTHWLPLPEAPLT